MDRSSGILCAVSSLPSPYGIGTFGKAAYDFTDFLENAGQRFWQMLPLGPTSYGDSPYQSFSSFAGNPYFIDPDLLVRDGLLTEEEIRSRDWGSDPRNVDYGKIYENRFALLAAAKTRGWKRDRDAVAAFEAENARWLPDYALFMACKRHFGMRAWSEWPDEIRMRRSEEVLNKYRGMLREDVELFTYIQYLFFRQWNALRSYVHGKGIRIIGDIPIYVAMDSADVWAEPYWFDLDAENNPVEVAGVPPDYFNENGQLWGNPLYRWDRMRGDGYGWWIRRVDGVSRLYDVLRFDHFMGLEIYWRVPYGDKTAKGGHYADGPGIGFVNVLKGWFPQLDFIAEDLGAPSPRVVRLLKEAGWPGMKVLEFAFDPREASNYLPHSTVENCIVYSCTHDNLPLMLWKEDQPPEVLEFAKEYLSLRDDEPFNWGILRAGQRTVAKLFVAPMQDYLGLGDGATMNRPGVPDGNWRWRLLPGEASDGLAAVILRMTDLYGRAPAERKRTDAEKARGKNAKGTADGAGSRGR